MKETDAVLVKELKELKEKVSILQHINNENAALLKYNTTDQLTGLLTREAFFRELQKLLERYPDEDFLFLRFDIDKFQTVNALFGYAEGDRLLKYCADALKAITSSQSENVIGRIDADIFCLCLKTDAVPDIEKLIPFSIEQFLENFRENYRFNMSIGLYLIENHYESMKDIYAKATMASKKCKDNSAIYYYQYDDTINNEIVKNQLIASKMHKALENGEFVPFFQPKVDLKTQNLIGAEALVRWLPPEGGLIPPSDFIPLFEQNGFIAKLDLYIFEAVCKYLQSWLEQGIAIVPISVNLSQRTLTHPDLLSTILSCVERYAINKRYIHFEITESAYAVNTKQSVQVANELAKNDFHLEMDDFGTGISSLTMLHELPVKTLKLDLRFIESYSQTHTNANIINFVVLLAKQMQLRLVAEGIEDKDQIMFLQSVGCDYGQGYLFSKPVPGDKFEEMLKNWKPLNIICVAHNIESTVNMADLWLPQSKFNIFFENIIGPAAIYEVQPNPFQMKILKTNEQYIKTISAEKPGEQYNFEQLKPNIVLQDCEALQEQFGEGVHRSASFSIRIHQENRHGNGRQFLKMNAHILFQNEDNTVLLAMFEDITDTQKTLTSLRQKVKNYENADFSLCQKLKTSRCATFRITKRALTLTYADDDFLQLYGYSKNYAFTHADTFFMSTLSEEDKIGIKKAFTALVKKKKNHFQWTMQILSNQQKNLSVLVTGHIRHENDGLYVDIMLKPLDDIKPVKEYADLSAVI